MSRALLKSRIPDLVDTPRAYQSTFLSSQSVIRTNRPELVYKRTADGAQQEATAARGGKSSSGKLTK